MRRTRLILLTVGALAAHRPLHAQWQLSGDAGVSHLRQTGIPESNALTLGGTFDAFGERAFFRSSLLAARATADRWTGQGLMLGALVDPSLRPVHWELTGALSAFGQSNEKGTSSGEGAARLRVGSSLRGAALGFGGGFSAHARETTPLGRVLGSGWVASGNEHFGIDLSFTHTGSQIVNGVVPLEGNTYVDAAASWRHERGGLSFGATAGVRDTERGIVASGGWASGDASVWMTASSALVISAGQTLEDAVRGVPRATYASVALRFAARPHVTLRSRASAGPRIRARRIASGAVTIEVHAPSASHVDLAADFTGWLPVRLTRSGDEWSVQREMRPGPHRVAIRIDGGEWIVPPNLPKIEDDLGGSAGVITIP